MKAICATNDGFEIAKTDLSLRGPGDFFGEKQHGNLNIKKAVDEFFSSELAVL